MRTLGLIIRGESFRDNGGKNTRMCGSDNKNQILCSESHIKNIIIPFRKHFDVSVELHTYRTRYTELLNQMYEPHILECYDKSTETQGSLHGKIMSNTTKEYDFLLVIRFDSLFKIDMCNLILHSTFDYNKIGYPHYLSNKKHPVMFHNMTKLGNPRISDSIVWIPKALKPFMPTDMLNISPHDMLDILPRQNVEMFYENIWTDSDTQQQQNPIYDIPSRPTSDCEYIDMKYTTYAVLLKNRLYVKHINKKDFLSTDNHLRKNAHATLLFYNDNGVGVMRGYDMPKFDTYATECDSTAEAKRIVALLNQNEEPITQINDHSIYHVDGKDFASLTFDKRLYNRLKILRDKFTLPKCVTEYIINLSDGDREENTLNPRNIPVYCFATLATNFENIMIPDIFFLKSNGYENIPCDNIPWEEKQNKAFWRGKSSGMPITRETYKILPRYILSTLSCEVLDAKISSWQFMDPNDRLLKQYLDSLSETGPAVKFQEFYKYKMQINIDGFGPAWNGFFMKLTSNCVVLHVESKFKQWYYHALFPWVHYIPVKRDMSDLNEKIQWVLRNDGKANEISKNARDIMRSFCYTGV